MTKTKTLTEAEQAALTDAELAALAAVDGTYARSRMPAAIIARLAKLGLVERRMAQWAAMADPRWEQTRAGE